MFVTYVSTPQSRLRRGVSTTRTYSERLELVSKLMADFAHGVRRLVSTGSAAMAQFGMTSQYDGQMRHLAQLNDAFMIRCER